MAGEDDVRNGAAERDDDRSQGPPVPSGPAPIIDLGGDGVPVRPVKPLGPRRLARLQRELAERARELEETGPADPELLAKQRRFTELAAQAEAAQAGPGRNDPVMGTAVPAPDAREPVPSRPAAPEEPPEPVEQITVVFPGGDASGGPGEHVPHDPVHVDPALFRDRLAPEELAALTHIEIVAPGDGEHHGSHSSTSAAPATADDHEDPGDAEDPPRDPAGPAAAATAEPAATAGPAVSWAEAEEDPPAAPVPASTAEGLELLAPREYRRRSGTGWWVLLLAVLAALAVVLVLFVL